MDRRILVALVALAACRPTAPRSQYVTEWAAIPYEVARSAGRPVVEATRANAYVALAIHEAFVAEPASQLNSLGGQVNGLWMLPQAPVGGVDGAIAAAEAARTLLDSLLPGSPVPDSLANAHVALRRREHVKELVAKRSIDHGRKIGLAVLAWSRMDGYAVSLRRAQTAKPPRAMNDADWGALRTFVLRNGDECAPAATSASAARTGSDSPDTAKAPYDSSRVLAREAAEGMMLAALTLADSEIAARRQRARADTPRRLDAQDREEQGRCIGARVASRIRSRR